MKTKSETRRDFLKKLGITGLSLPFFSQPLFSAEDEVPIKRLLLIEHPDGINPEHWYPTGSLRDFNLQAMTEPFNEVKEECVFLEGINLGGTLAGHGSREGFWRGDKNRNSIDQYFAEKWRGQTDVPIIIHKASDLRNGATSLSYDSTGKIIPAITNPLNILDKIYTSDDIEETKLASLQREIKRLGSVQNDLDSLMQGDMSANVLLQAHDKALKDVLNALNSSDGDKTIVNMDAWKNAFVDKATEGGLINRSESRWNNKILADNGAFNLMADLHEDAIITALKYDRTRVINYSYGCDIWDFYMPCDNGEQHPYHNAGHAMNQGHIETRKTTSNRVAKIIKKLRETDDIYGNSLLDSTLVVYGCEIGHASNHSNQNVPFILAGAGLEGGRYIKYDGLLWNKVLVSIANLMGDNLTRFGNTDLEGGALPDLV